MSLLQISFALLILSISCSNGRRKRPSYGQLKHMKTGKCLAPTGYKSGSILKIDKLFGFSWSIENDTGLTYSDTGLHLSDYGILWQKGEVHSNHRSFESSETYQGPIQFGAKYEHYSYTYFQLVASSRSIESVNRDKCLGWRGSTNLVSLIDCTENIESHLRDKRFPSDLWRYGTSKFDCWTTTTGMEISGERGSDIFSDWGNAAEYSKYFVDFDFGEIKIYSKTMTTVGKRIEKDGVHRPEKGWYIHLLSENSTQMRVVIMPELQRHMCLTYGGGSRKQLALRYCRGRRSDTWILDIQPATPPENGEVIRAMDSSIQNGGLDFDRVWDLLEGYDLSFVGTDGLPTANYEKALKYVAASQVNPCLLARMIELSAFQPAASFTFVNPLNDERLHKVVHRKIDQRRDDSAATGSVEFTNNDAGWKELHWCAHLDFQTLAKFLLNKDPSKVHEKDRNGASIFDMAIKYNHTEFARMLMNEKFVNISQKQGRETLYHAVLDRNLALVKLLMAEGANTEMKYDDREVTALHASAYRGNVEIGEALLTRADVNVETNNRDTPLHYACYYKRPKFVELFLKHNANVFIVNKSSGYYPIHIAARLGYVEIGEILLKYEPSLKELKDLKDGNTPLHYAVSFGNEGFEALLKDVYNVNTGITNDDGQTAYGLNPKKKP